MNHLNRFKHMRSPFCWLPVVLTAMLILGGMASPLQGASLNKAQLANILTGYTAQLVNNPSLVVKTAQGSILVESTLHSRLQDNAQDLLRKARALRCSLVLLDAQTGQVLVLAGAKGNKPEVKVALDAGIPAASIFKIITAAAAVEETNLTPNSQFTYVGRPHTLYASQIKPGQPPQGNKVSLRQSFATSNNPVFARLGIYLLGRDLLLWYGRALGFESRIPFELPLGVSALSPASTQFAIGELASGYNRDTTISPLHAALLGGVFLNGGRLMEPYMVRQVSSDGGDIIYQGGPRSLGRVVSVKTAKYMLGMFEATVKEGTARTYFRRNSNDPVLRNLFIGGKTGTISRQQINEHYEWFVGLAQDGDNGRSYAIASLVVHGKTRGQSAKELARLLLRQAFSEQNPTQVVYRAGKPSS
jgi:cell division protein FtsI/penicillin-binding protein 2